MVRKVLAGKGRGQATRGAGKEAEAVRNRRDLVGNHEMARFAAVGCLEVGKGGCIRIDGIGNRQQCGGALARWGRRPGGEGPLRRFDCGIDLLRARLRQAVAALAGGGREDRFGFTLAGDQGSVDQHQILHLHSSQLVVQLPGLAAVTGSGAQRWAATISTRAISASARAPRIILEWEPSPIRAAPTAGPNMLPTNMMM